MCDKDWSEEAIVKKQGRIHGNPAADGWAGAVMRKPLAIKKCDLPTDIASSRVACPLLKTGIFGANDNVIQP